MKAAVPLGPGGLTLLEVDMPAAEPQDIVATGICGSDLTSYATGVYVRSGQIRGHEFAGTVVDVGADVPSLSFGQHVKVLSRPVRRLSGVLARACSGL